MRWAEPTIKQMFDQRDLNQFKTLLPSTSLNEKAFKHTFEHMFNEINVAKGSMDPALLDYLDVFCNHHQDFLADIINEPPYDRFQACYLARAIQNDNLALAKFLMSKGASVESKYVSLSDQRKGDQRTIEDVISNNPILKKELQTKKPRQSQGFMCCAGRPKL